MNKKEKYAKLFERKKSIKLDVGCSDHKQQGWVGLDIRKCKGVYIVHDVQKFPWPIPDNSCSTILMSQLIEHIRPEYRYAVIDECWLIINPGGQLLIAAPYAGSVGANQDLSHYTCPNEASFTYFDPAYPLYQIYKLKPWTLVRNAYRMAYNLEVIMEPRKTARGGVASLKGIEKKTLGRKKKCSKTSSK